MKSKIFVTLCFVATFSLFHSQKLSFKDKNFEKAIVENYDLNKDHLIDKIEATKVVRAFLVKKNITSAEDLNLFPNVKMVLLDENAISDIYLKNLDKLELFSCTSCKISSFKADHLINLTSLYLDHNILKNISLKDTPRIDQLTLSLNQLKFIDVTQLKSLRKLNLEHNQIHQLDISGNTVLQTLNVSGNKITKSDIRQGAKTDVIIFGMDL